MLFLRALVLQDTWSNRMLNLGGFGSGLLTFFVSGLSGTILVDIERLKSFCVLLALFGPNPRGTVASSVSPGISVSPLFTITKLRTPAWHPQCASKQTCASSLSSSLWSVIRMPLAHQQGQSDASCSPVMGQDTLPSGKALSVIPIMDLDTQPAFHSSPLASAAALWPCFS